MLRTIRRALTARARRLWHRALRPGMQRLIWRLLPQVVGVVVICAVFFSTGDVPRLGAAPVAQAAGTLTETISSLTSISATLNGLDQTKTYTLSATVADTSGSARGWALTLTSTQFASRQGHTLPANASTVTGVTVRCARHYRCVSMPVDTVIYPLAVPAARSLPSPGTLYNAALNSGDGTFTITATIAVRIPANAYADTYTSTVTLGVQGGMYLALDGGGSGSSPYIVDGGYVSGGNTYTNSNAINTSNVSNPAPQEVYQSERYGNSFTYTIPGLTAGQTYTVRLHFAEIYWSTPNTRIFNVAINGAQVLSNFDIFAAAGGKNIAIVKSFSTTANGAGQIVIAFTTIKDNAKISGIEICTSC